MDYKFMQIFGNCNDIFYLGENRVHGPVDNVITKTAKVVDLLLNDKYIEYLNTARYKLLDRKWGLVDTEPNKMYDFEDVLVVHNDILQEKYWLNIQKRRAAFNLFYKDIFSDKSKYFVVSLTRILVNQDYSSPNVEFYLLLELLNNYGLLDKTIFVQFDKGQGITKEKWTCKIDNWWPLQKKFKNKLKVVTIKYGAYDKVIGEKINKRFIEDVTALIEGD